MMKYEISIYRHRCTFKCLVDMYIQINLRTYTYKHAQILRLFRFFSTGNICKASFLRFEKGFNGQLFTGRISFFYSAEKPNACPLKNSGFSIRRFFHFEIGPKNKWLEDVFPIEIVTF